MQTPIMKHMLRPDGKKKLCPVLGSPLEGCYCNRMSSQDIERAIYLCTAHFEICDIYNLRQMSAGSG